MKRWSAVPREMVLAAGLLLAGCSVGEFNREELVREQLDAARNQWISAGYEDYSFVVRRACGNCQGGTEFARIVVRNNARESGTFFESGDAVPDAELALYPTILELFDVIDDAIRDGAAEITVQYNSLLGYPSAIFVDRVVDTLNDELSYTAHTVEPLTGG